MFVIAYIIFFLMVTCEFYYKGYSDFKKEKFELRHHVCIIVILFVLWHILLVLSFMDNNKPTDSERLVTIREYKYNVDKLLGY